MQSQMTTPAPLLTAGDVCKLLRVSDKTLGAAIRAGKFPAPTVTFGERTRRWSRESIEKFLANGTH